MRYKAAMKLDLHCHTHHSDGTQSLDWVVERAEQNAVTHLAITDHDFVTDLREIAKTANVELISGVEISCFWSNTEIHVVGLFIDTANDDLGRLLEKQRASRTARVRAMSERLVDLGVPGLMDYLDTLPAEVYTRSHVANFVVQKGLSRTRQKAFKQYLGKGGKVYEPGNWCELDQAINAIQSAGGISVLAHPGRYPLNKRKLAELVEGFASAKGDALEVRYPNIDPQMMARLESLALNTGLLLSGGSDFHDPEAHWTDVGKFPAIRGEAAKRGVHHHARWSASVG